VVAHRQDRDGYAAREDDARALLST